MGKGPKTARGFGDIGSWLGSALAHVGQGGGANDHQRRSLADGGAGNQPPGATAFGVVADSPTIEVAIGDGVCPVAWVLGGATAFYAATARARITGVPEGFLVWAELNDGTGHSTDEVGPMSARPGQSSVAIGDTTRIAGPAETVFDLYWTVPEGTDLEATLLVDVDFTAIPIET